MPAERCTRVFLRAIAGTQCSSHRPTCTPWSMASYSSKFTWNTVLATIRDDRKQHLAYNSPMRQHFSGSRKVPLPARALYQCSLLRAIAATKVLFASRSPECVVHDVVLDKVRLKRAPGHGGMLPRTAMTGCSVWPSGFSLQLHLCNHAGFRCHGYPDRVATPWRRQTGQ